VTGNFISTLIFSLHPLNYFVLTHKLRVLPFSHTAHVICTYQCSENDTFFCAYSTSYCVHSLHHFKKKDTVQFHALQLPQF